MNDFSKAYFQKVWGDQGYVEHFSYGVGIQKVFDVCINPFLSDDPPNLKNVLEIGSGGGTFTELILPNCQHLTAIDVIKRPQAFEEFKNFTYHELPDKSFDCGPVKARSIDFAFSYNVFCHLSNDAIKTYLKSIYKVLKKGGDLVFMLSNFEHTKKHTKNWQAYSVGDLLPMGHFYQSDETITAVVGKEWAIVSRNMLPEHRDIIVHLKK